MPDLVFFGFVVVWDKALPATDFEFELYRSSFKILDAVVATVLEVCFLLAIGANLLPYVIVSDYYKYIRTGSAGQQIGGSEMIKNLIWLLITVVVVLVPLQQIPGRSDAGKGGQARGND